MTNPNKQSYEPNPLMLGLAYFITFITLVILIALACSGELMQGRNSAAILCFALFAHLTVTETVKYRRYTRQRREETALDDEALPTPPGCEGEATSAANEVGLAELPERQVYRSYLEGPNVVPKPKMLDKMCRNGIAFSWFSLLLGPLYYLYRKQYVAGWLYTWAFAAFL